MKLPQGELQTQPWYRELAARLKFSLDTAMDEIEQIWDSVMSGEMALPTPQCTDILDWWRQGYFVHSAKKMKKNAAPEISGPK